MSDLKTDFTTTWIIGLTVLLWGAYDVYAFRKSGRGHTLSEVITTYSLRHPLVAFVGGVLCGHFFWPQVLRSCELLTEFCK